MDTAKALGLIALALGWVACVLAAAALPFFVIWYLVTH